MKITISRHELLSKLQNVGRIIESNRQYPNLESFVFEVKDNAVSVTGANNEGYISTTLDCEVSDESFEGFLLDAKTLQNAIKEIPEQPLSITVDVADIEFSYKNGKFKMPYMKSTYERSQIVPESTLIVSSETIEEGLKSCMRFTASDELRPMMTTIDVSYSAENKEIVFAASDGSKLAKKTIGLDKESDFHVNLPSRAAKMIIDMIGRKVMPIEMRLNRNTIEAHINGYIICYRLLEGKFPNFNSVIPNNPYTLSVNRSNLLAAIKRVSVFSNDASALIEFSIKQTELEITGRDIDLRQSAVETMSVDYLGSDMQIGFKATFLADILNTLEADEIKATFKSPSTASVFTPYDEDGSLYLLMPMQINV